jgi:hypothetical protein
MNRDGMALAQELRPLDAEVRRRLWCESSLSVYLYTILSTILTQGFCLLWIGNTANLSRSSSFMYYILDSFQCLALRRPYMILDQVSDLAETM